MPLTRRQFNKSVAAATVSLMATNRSSAADAPQWLLFTKSAGYEHDVIKRPGDAPSFAHVQLAPLFAERGLKLVESKDGRLFDPAAIKAYAGFVFYTSGDLTTEGTDKQPPMTAAGKQALLDAVAAGTPFIGLHSAADSFHAPRDVADAPIDPYIAMIGGEFVVHGEQQHSTARIVDAQFPGIGKQPDWSFNEEWYTFRNFANDIHPIHLLETADMKGDMYAKPPFPLTWTRLHGKGRVFYTGIGHREDVVSSKAFLKLMGGAIDWCRTPTNP